jgi:hypothetical protein
MMRSTDMSTKRSLGNLQTTVASEKEMSCVRSMFSHKFASYCTLMATESCTATCRDYPSLPELERQLSAARRLLQLRKLHSQPERRSLQQLQNLQNQPLYTTVTESFSAIKEVTPGNSLEPWPGPQGRPVPARPSHWYTARPPT